MQLNRPGSTPSAKGPEEYFTGTVRIDMLNVAPAPSRVSCASVTFEPGAALPGTTIHSDRRSSSPQGADGRSVKVKPSSRFGPAT